MARLNPSEEARRTSIIVLFCLMEDEINGYTLRQRLDKWGIQDHLPVSPATIYRSLSKLQEQGCLTRRTVQNGNYPPSEVFTITKEGKAHYRELLKQEADFSRTEFNEHVFIGTSSYLAVSERIRLAKKRKEQAKEHLQSLQDRLERYVERKGKPYAEWLLIDHEIHMVKSQIGWLDHFIDLLEQGKAGKPPAPK